MLWGSWRRWIAAAIAAGIFTQAHPASAAPPSDLPSTYPGLSTLGVPPSAQPPTGPDALSPSSDLPIRDLTPPGFATDAPPVHPAYRDTIPGFLTPSVPVEGGPFVTAEFLLFRPHRSDFDFVVPGDTTGLVPTGDVRSLNYNLQPGLRGEFGHRFGGSGWEAFFGYTYFHSSAFDQLLAPPGLVLFPTLTKPGLTNTVQFAGADANFDYNVYDLMLGKRFSIDEHFAVRLTGGLRFASIRQGFNAYYDGLDAHAAQVSARSNFQGFGPIVGGEAVWAGWKGFHLYARANAGMLSGQSDNPYVETNNSGNTVYANTAYNIRTVAPMTSMAVGGGWQYRTVSIRAGYEITNYFNVVNQPRFTDDVSVGKMVTRPSNVSLEGLFVQAGLAF
ncbi:MAG TPA: Lpg1974 family pore-forming outer membrane protein [Urbifossiella sp.]|jgi:hypothetical protein